MDKRSQIIAEIQQQIRKKRAEMDPKVLAHVQTAVEKAQGLEAKPVMPDTVPYDKEAARDTIEMFLENHPDKLEFQRKLHAFLKSQSH